MAASGKKAKKHKGKTIPLTDFLADGTSGPGPGKIIVNRNMTWADEVENEDDSYYTSNRSKQPVILPTGPREARSARNVDEENIPRSPPFKAYIVNLHYETNETDIRELFEDMKIIDVQLPRDDRGSGRLKGFGYIEFETRENLIAALVMDDTSIKGRRMRIEVSINNETGNNNEQRRGGYGGSDRRYENREYDSERTQGDWRSGPRAEPPLPNTKPAFSRNTANIPKDRGAFTRNNMDGPLVRDEECFTRDNIVEQGSFTRYNADASTREVCSFSRENMDQMVRARDHSDGAMNRDFRAVSGNDGRFGNRGRYRDTNNMSRGTTYSNTYEERDRHFGNRAERNNSYYSDDRVHPQNYDDKRNPPELDTPAEVKTRPKLCLAQQTVAKTEDRLPAAVQSAIFGGARPVDTAAREKEIEDNRMRQRESHSMRQLENDDVNAGDGTLTTNFDGKSFESGDQNLGVADGGQSLDQEENGECTENDKCRYETPGIELVVDEERLTKSEIISHTPRKEVEVLVKQHLMQAPAVRSSIFGGATPVDTSTREREVEERLAKSTEKIAISRDKPLKEVEALVMQHLQKPPARSTIFGGATPVDTSAREREVEERLAREREEKRARDEWRLSREKKGVKYGGVDAIPSVRQSIIYGGGAARPPRPPSVEAGVREIDTRLAKHGADTRRRVICNIDEQQIKKEEHEQQQVAKKYELAQPPVENVWLRRAAQQAANQERGQMFAPPMAFKNTHGL